MKLSSLAIPTLLAASVAGCAVTTGGDDTDVSNWRDAIVASPSTADGCFHATYPEMTWDQIGCTAAPNRAFSSRKTKAVPFTVGNGDDYALQVTGLIAKASGTFLHLKNVTTEDDGGSPNDYSIQLNSNFMSGTAACNGVAGCMSWAQFVYSASAESAFLQNWLLGIGTCPSASWFADGQGDCYSNSAAVAVPVIAIGDLGSLKMSAGSIANGNDSLVFANGTEAYATNEQDNITDLGSAWTAAEFNIIGDGNSSEAVFDTGASVTVRIDVLDHTTTAPSCIANDGTTGETNNLNLGACKTFGGPNPSIEFSESD